MTVTGLITYADHSKADANRLVVCLRVPCQKRIGTVLDFQTGKYTQYEYVPSVRDDYFYVWTNTLHGQLIGTFCQQNVKRQPVTLTCEPTTYGWRIEQADYEMVPITEATL